MEMNQKPLSLQKLNDEIKILREQMYATFLKQETYGMNEEVNDALRKDESKRLSALCSRVNDMHILCAETKQDVRDILDRNETIDSVIIGSGLIGLIVLAVIGLASLIVN
jgi:hypothetical protein